MGKILNVYCYEVNLPCPKCHNLIRVKIDEKPEFCPFCHAKLNTSS